LYVYCIYIYSVYIYTYIYIYIYIYILTYVYIYCTLLYIYIYIYIYMYCIYTVYIVYIHILYCIIITPPLGRDPVVCFCWEVRMSLCLSFVFSLDNVMLCFHLVAFCGFGIQVKGPKSNLTCSSISHVCGPLFLLMTATR
jgi:hypothetical protein